jgi:hypothetical protein
MIATGRPALLRYCNVVGCDGMDMQNDRGDNNSRATSTLKEIFGRKDAVTECGLNWLRYVSTHWLCQRHTVQACVSGILCKPVSGILCKSVLGAYCASLSAAYCASLCHGHAVKVCATWFGAQERIKMAAE